MTDQTAAGAGRTRIIFFALCILLILTLAWRLFVPAHEYPSRAAMILDMVIDGAMLVGLIGIRNAGPKPLFWIALVAGIGLFAIRFTSDAAWWTGHLVYYLPAR